ncbi:MAG: CDP-alcohol phosphatidyltransferase family protein [Myxococcota bacterium]
MQKTPNAPNAWIVEMEDAADVRIWGLTPPQRQRRLLERAGCVSIRSVSPDESVPDPLECETVMIARADAICDERLIEGVLAATNAVLVAPRRQGWGGPVAAHVSAEHAADVLEMMRRAASGQTDAADRVLADGLSDSCMDRSSRLRLVGPADVASSYTVKLRKFDPPFIYPARAEAARAVEDRLFESSYKGVTDLITKWLWPKPAAAVVRVLANTGVKPNTVTVLSWLLTIAAGVLFWKGWFGVGLLCGWAMTFLDTVDGKLARVTMTSSRIGHVLDHGLDIVHPPIWYLLWGMGLHSGDYATSQSLYAATLIVVVGYLVGRALEGAFILRFKFEMHCWRPIDSLFRTISARRNPNLILLSVGTLGGRPDLGLVMVAIWTVVSIGFHLERLVQALVERSKGAEIVCWHEAQIATAEGPEAHVGAVR